MFWCCCSGAAPVWRDVFKLVKSDGSIALSLDHFDSESTARESFSFHAGDTFQGWPLDVAIDGSGNFLTTGQFRFSAGSTVAVKKRNSSGVVQWSASGNGKLIHLGTDWLVQSGSAALIRLANASGAASWTQSPGNLDGTLNGHLLHGSVVYARRADVFYRKLDHDLTRLTWAGQDTVGAKEIEPTSTGGWVSCEADDTLTLRDADLKVVDLGFHSGPGTVNSMRIDSNDDVALGTGSGTIASLTVGRTIKMSADLQTELWNINVGSSRYVAVLSDDTVITEGKTSGVMNTKKLNASTGATIWTATNTYGPYAIDSSDNIYCASGHKIDSGGTVSGTTWTADAEKGIAVESDGSAVYLGAKSIDPSDGSTNWTGTDCGARRALYSGHLYGVTHNATSQVITLTKVDASDGSSVATDPLTYTTSSATVRADVHVDADGVHCAVEPVGAAQGGRDGNPIAVDIADGKAIVGPDAAGGQSNSTTNHLDESSAIWFQWDGTKLWGVGHKWDSTAWKRAVVVWLNPATGERGHYAPSTFPIAAEDAAVSVLPDYWLNVDAANSCWFWIGETGVLERWGFDGVLDASSGVAGGGSPTNYLYRHFVRDGSYIYALRYRATSTGDHDAVVKLNASDLSEVWATGPGDGLRTGDTGETLCQGFIHLDPDGTHVWVAGPRVLV